ncbi:MAG: GH92 family glycosyl hydrolase [Kiritimatiellae bacterium]|nr:GH92 family glycosyl hydrolase [Kiritimatiellia bacterium]
MGIACGKALAIGVALLATGARAAGSAAAGADLVRWVDPFIGTVGSGNTFPGACRPFGLVQASPDVAKLTPGGYKGDCDEFVGFSNTHLSGTGNPACGDVRMLPFVGEHESDFFSAKVDKSTERGAPDYYAVTLKESGVRVEATATERVGLWRFTYAGDGPARLFFDPVSSLCLGWTRKWGPNVVSASMDFAPDGRSIRGGRHVREWADREMFYSVRFDRPFSVVRRIPVNPFDGAGERAVLAFDVPKGGTLEVRVAISTVSPEGAELAFASETDGRTFDQVRAETRAKWNALLGRVEAEGTESDLVNFYTSLYHLFIQPADIADADGRYRGTDGKVVKAPCGSYYSTLSLWDTFRAAHPLYTILAPELVDGFVETMVAHGRAHGHLPIWTLWGKEIHGMIGVHSIPVIVDAYMKGFRNFDAAEALDLMVRSLTDAKVCRKRNDWNVFWENGGYYPYRQGEWDENWHGDGCVSRTLEIAYDWWCVAEFAKALGNERAAADAAERASGWRKVFDEKTGFARGRGPSYAGGEWREPFDPRQSRLPGSHYGDYTEGNAWQYTWHVFQEPDALAELMGGRAAAVAKLDEMFSTPPLRPESRSANNDDGGFEEMSGQIGQYWHGNEPSHHIVYLYSAYGAPEKGQRLLRRIFRTCYRAAPDGLCGNDDCGQMSAWYLFTAMGFYPLNPCGGEYVVGAPQLPRVTLRLGGEKTFTVVAKNLSDENMVVKSATLDGKPVLDWKIRHADVMRGGVLSFEMAPPARSREGR